MSPLDSMLSQYTQQYRQPQSVTNVPTTPSAPGRPGFDVSAPSSFFAAAGGGGFGAGPSNISAGGFSRGSSPFGQGIPDLSKADPATLARLSGGMEGLIYNASTLGGGYIHGDYGSKPGEKYGPYYKGQPPASDPSANRAARDYYNYIGDLPTRSVGTQALNSLPGYSPSAGPSYNATLGGVFNNSNSYFQSRLREAGFSPTYEGPFNIPGY